jgi:hypothetical protein
VTLVSLLFVKFNHLLRNGWWLLVHVELVRDCMYASAWLGLWPDTTPLSAHYNVNYNSTGVSGKLPHSDQDPG